MTTDTHRIRAERNLYAIRYIEQAHAKGTPVTDAIRQVAAEQGRDPSSVSSAWYRANPGMRRKQPVRLVGIIAEPDKPVVTIEADLSGIHEQLRQLAASIDALAKAFAEFTQAGPTDGEAI